MPFKVGNIFSETKQITRIIVLTGILLVLVAVSFGGYYYYDRYYNPPEPDVQEMNVAQAEQAVRDNPQDLEKHLTLSETYMFAQQFDETITQTNQILTIEPETERT